ncbi:MAG TPA: hypothetical protein ENG59_05020 [Chloroflexi bacterium]|nr:MAG: hypothetical protein DRI46_00610 [Chloroflexota bacterium]HDD55581.1 hypothetical protein [Chloroflexota bacterium]
MDQNRGNWYLLTGLVLGLIMGLVYAWVISPIEEVDSHPHLLREDYQDIYRALISRAYQANNNLPRAEARLELIADEDPALALAAQAQRYLAEGGDVGTAKVLANLSAALQSAAIPAETPLAPSTEENSQDQQTGTQITPTVGDNGEEAAQSTPTSEVEEPSAPTLTPTESPPFILQDSSPICDPTLGESLIQIIATTGEGEGVPGVALEISLGPDLKEVFYTGLKPEMGLGYADFLAEPGLTYTFEVPESGLVVSDIEVPICSTDTEDSYWGGWEIYITHPN